MIIRENEIWECELSISFFAHEVFIGNVRVVVVDPYRGGYRIVGEDMAAVLGYENTKDAVSKYVNPEDRQAGVIIYNSQLGQEEQTLTLINGVGMRSLIFSSKFYTGGAVTLDWHNRK